jgi:uncharacterized protein
MAALDGKGDLLASTTFELSKGADKVEEAKKVVGAYCSRYQVEAIAVGNGTGGRDTETFLRGLDRESLNDAPVVLVNEAGASVYSASEAARQEFPDLDVTLRGAISIGRRLQDPLAELVKIEPKSIGVGQYQHDVDQDALKLALDDVVESCVNAVGVDVNTASPQLLSYVAGIGPARAQALVSHRRAQGRFTDRRHLLRVPGLGPKTFEQAAGFLRIHAGDNPLDASAVHPERYELVQRMAADLSVDVAALMSDVEARAKIDPNKYVNGEVGLPTLQDIMTELARPGRDPRDRFEPVRFDPNVTEIAHLQEGMVLEGVVTNVADFGAFVDVGVHQDGLVHLSELSWTYTEDPNKRVAVGDHVKVKVIGVDRERRRISLSIKQTTPAPKRPEPAPRPQLPRPPRESRAPQERGPRPGDGRPGERGPRPGDGRPSERPPYDRERRPDARGPERRPDQRDRRPDQRDRGRPGGRPEERPAAKAGKPHWDSPFAVLFMENGVVKIKDKEDPKAKKPGGKA